MTPTEADLRSAFAAKADEADAGSELLATLTRGRGETNRRQARVLWPAGAAAAVVAAAALATTMLTSTGTHRPAPSAASQPPALAVAPTSFDVRQFYFDLVGSYPGVPIGLESSATTQTMMLADDGNRFAVVSLYAAGQPLRNHPIDASPVTVNGAPGYSWHPAGDSLPSGRPWFLSWQYAPDAWATIGPDLSSTNALTVATELQIADAVRPGMTQVLRVPFALGTLPRGQQLEQVRSTLGAPDTGAMVIYGSSESDNVLSVAATPQDGVTLPPAGSTPVTAGPYNGWWGDSGFMLPGPGYVVALNLGPSAIADPTEMGESDVLDAAASLTLAPSLTDRSTWFDAETALPAGP